MRIAIFFLVAILLARTAAAQVSDTVTEHLMTLRARDCDAERLNAIRLLPGLYRRHKTDTIAAIINYLDRYCGLGEPLSNFKLMESLQTGSFNEEVYSGDCGRPARFTGLCRGSIVPWLEEYKDGCYIRAKPVLYLADSGNKELIGVYESYFDFLQELASALPDTISNPAGRFLAAYYKHKARLDDLDSSIYDNTVLQTIYENRHHYSVVTSAPVSEKNNFTNQLKSYGAITEADLAPLLNRQVIRCDEASLTAVKLIPKLYAEHGNDTINAIIDYLERNCGVSEPFYSYRLLMSLKNHTFRERMRKMSRDTVFRYDYYLANELSYLHWYRLGCVIRQHPAWYSREDTSRRVVEPYANYYNFLQSLATDVCHDTALTPLERVLALNYAHPDTSYLGELKNKEYNGSALKEMYDQSYLKQEYISGFSIGIVSGVWAPTGGLASLGGHPCFGICIGGRSDLLMYQLEYLERTGGAQRSYTARYNDTPYVSGQLEGHYIGAGFGLDLLKTGRHEADFLWGAALDATDIATGPGIQSTLKSFDASVGLGYKLFLTYERMAKKERYSYLSIEAKYHFLNYNNPGGSDFSGNALSLSLIYALYSHKMHLYYNIP